MFAKQFRRGERRVRATDLVVCIEKVAHLDPRLDALWDIARPVNLEPAAEEE